MKNDFTSLYNSIDKPEQKEFQQYIEVFYGQQKSVLEVFNQLTQSVGKGKKSPIGADPIPKNTLNALSDLKRWLLEFLTIQEVKSNSYDAKFLTLEALRKRGLKEAEAKKTEQPNHELTDYQNPFKETFLKKSAQLNQELTEHKSPDIWLPLMKLRLADADYFNMDIDKVKDYKVKMDHILNELNSFYIGAILKYSAELYNRTGILEEEYEPKLLPSILSLIKNDNSLNPVIRLSAAIEKPVILIENGY